MSSDAKTDEGPIRLVFELTRADHPRLYDDLIRFPKGTKRINRLRVLAHDGLLVQGGYMVPAGGQPFDRESSGLVSEGGGTLLTNDLFGPPLAE